MGLKQSVQKAILYFSTFLFLFSIGYAAVKILTGGYSDDLLGGVFVGCMASIILFFLASVLLTDLPRVKYEPESIIYRNIIPHDFKYFDAYCRDMKDNNWKWVDSEEDSTLNDAKIFRYKATKSGARRKGGSVSYKFSGTTRTAYSSSSSKLCDVTDTVEIIYIPFSTEEECEKKEKLIKKTYKRSYSTEVKHYLFDKVHIVVMIKEDNPKPRFHYNFPDFVLKE
ncbi:hypothetical protein [Methanobrevibacter sp.]|uniref:hypothetical protein n=1 Tax=Methanobrevibacter sp. TaxID=66852 RepID=UPI0026DFBA24|nr:hypothetical protein [Methanobrevibacter sp.]MDO5859124.1 hypothetical protein [Methanobrevibacter sp.]